MCRMGKRLLLIEDTGSIAVLLEATLRRDGYKVDIAGTAAEGLRLFEEAAAGPVPYDLLLVDLNLPDGDGTELLGRFACHKACPPRFALSADATRRARSRARAAGAERFFEKPFDLAEVRQAIGDVVGADPTLRSHKAEPDQVAEQARMTAQYLLFLESIADEFEAQVALKRLGSLLHQIGGSATLYGMARLSGLAQSLSARLQTEGPAVACDIRAVLRQELRVAAQEARLASCDVSIAK